MDLTKLLTLLPMVGPVVAAAPEFVALFKLGMDMLDPQDQAVAKQALADIQADNDIGHKRLQEKLAAAAKR